MLPFDELGGNGGFFVLNLLVLRGVFFFILRV